MFCILNEREQFVSLTAAFRPNCTYFLVVLILDLIVLSITDLSFLIEHLSN